MISLSFLSCCCFSFFLGILNISILLLYIMLCINVYKRIFFFYKYASCRLKRCGSDAMFGLFAWPSVSVKQGAALTIGRKVVKIE